MNTSEVINQTSSFSVTKYDPVQIDCVLLLCIVKSLDAVLKFGRLFRIREGLGK